jgi:phosphohistidine phosphatase
MATAARWRRIGGNDVGACCHRLADRETLWSVLTLLLLRHAKSDWDDPALPDHDRPLSPRGLMDGRRMGQWLAQAAPPTKIVCSTAHRAMATASLVVSGVAHAADIIGSPRLYLAEPRLVVEEIVRLGDSSSVLMVIGHNPGLEELATRLSGVATTLPTAALARLTVPLNHWGRLCLETRAALGGVWTPKSLAS